MHSPFIVRVSCTEYAKPPSALQFTERQMGSSYENLQPLALFMLPLSVKVQSQIAHVE